MDGTQFAELINDISENGLRDPIVLLDGQILDGRNRYRAMRSLDPTFSPDNAPKMFVDFNDGDPLEWVVSKNLHRRHLKESQRAIIAAKVSLANPGINRWQTGASSPKAAKMLNVSTGLVNEAKRIIKEAPHSVAAIESGQQRIGRRKFDGTISAAVGVELRDKFTQLCVRLKRSKYDVLKELVQRSVDGRIDLVPVREHQSATAEQTTQQGKDDVDDDDSNNRPANDVDEANNDRAGRCGNRDQWNK